MIERETETVREREMRERDTGTGTGNLISPYARLFVRRVLHHAMHLEFPAPLSPAKRYPIRCPAKVAPVSPNALYLRALAAPSRAFAPDARARAPPQAVLQGVLRRHKDGRPLPLPRQPQPLRGAPAAAARPRRAKRRVRHLLRHAAHPSRCSTLSHRAARVWCQCAAPPCTSATPQDSERNSEAKRRAPVSNPSRQWRPAHARP